MGTTQECHILFEQILEAAPHKTTAVCQLASHLTNHPSKTNMLGPEVRIKWCFLCIYIMFLAIYNVQSKFSLIRLHLLIYTNERIRLAINCLFFHCVLGLELNSIWWWKSSSGIQGSVKSHFIIITFRSNLT